MNFEVHVSFSVSDDGVMMCGGVIHELGDFVHCCFSSFGFFGGNGAEGSEHCAIEGSGIIQEFSNDTLDLEDYVFVEGGRACVVG